MVKKLKYLFLLFSFILLSVFIQTNAFSWTEKPLSMIEKTVEVVTRRVSDIMYFLFMQKEYIFNNYQDPNVYLDWQTDQGFEEVVSKIVATSTQAPIPSTNLPVSVTTTTIPAVSKTTPSASVTVTSQVATTVPILIKPPVINEVKPTIVTPTLAVSPILSLTNLERAKEGLKALGPDTSLDQVAMLRANDILQNQYFEHESPVGNSAPNLAKRLNYDYILIGENLALGNFDGDKGIVEAWMESPGHKANILNSQYRELGVAVKTGEFNDSTVTVAVQIFATPMSNCPKPNAEIKNLIDESTKSIKQMQTQAQTMFVNLETMRTTPALDRSYYSQKIQEYNYFARQVNDAVAGLKAIVDVYNKEVGQYNICISVN